MEIRRESVEFVSYQGTGDFIAACIEVLPADRIEQTLTDLGAVLSRELYQTPTSDFYSWDMNSFGMLVLRCVLGTDE
jgi:hypothetical protein